MIDTLFIIVGGIGFATFTVLLALAMIVIPVLVIDALLDGVNGQGS